MKPSTQDNIEGTSKIASGAVKQDTGKILGRPKLEVAGANERFEGHVQKKIGQVEKVLDR